MQMLGDQALSRGEVAEALSCFDRRLQLVPDDHTLRQRVIQLSRRMKRKEQVQRVTHGVRLSLVLIALWGTAIALATYWLQERPGESPVVKAPAKQPVFHAEQVEPIRVAHVTTPGAPKTPVVQAPPRTVEFRLSPFGTLTVDGTVVAEDAQKPVPVSLTPGTHHYRADNPYRVSVEKDLEVPADGPIDPVAIHLDVFRPGRLIIHSDPGADAVVDGDARGPAAASELQPFMIPLLHGERVVEVKVVKAGKSDKNERVVVRAGQTAEVTAKW